MEKTVTYFEKHCKNCAGVKTFKRTVYPNGKANQRCVDCCRESSNKSHSRPEFKELRKQYEKKRRQQLHEAGIVKPRGIVVLQSVYNQDGLKRCNKCFEFKEESTYFPHRGNGKYHTTCKQCRVAQALATLKQNNERLERKRAYDRGISAQRDPEKNKEICARYQAKVRPIRQKESLKRQLLKGLSCKAHWYYCKHCNTLKYSKGRHNNSEACNSCKNIGRTFTVAPRQAICPVCNKSHIAKNTNARCPQCVKYANRLLRNILGRKRKAKIRKATIAHNVDPLYIFKRDRYKCKFCGVKVQKQDIYADNAAELDHIIPISKGGAHADYNCQTLCRRCNQAKSNKMIGQLLIAI